MNNPVPQIHTKKSIVIKIIRIVFAVIISLAGLLQLYLAVGDIILLRNGAILSIITEFLPGITLLFIAFMLAAKFRIWTIYLLLILIGTSIGLYYYQNNIVIPQERAAAQNQINQCIEECNTRRNTTPNKNTVYGPDQSCQADCTWNRAVLLKPVIYLYPQSQETVLVQLSLNGKLIADYPKYNSALQGWNVTAFPDGHLINQADNQEYSYLFWEGQPITPIHYDLSTGFIVKGEDVRDFLQDTLSKMGLTPKEYNEFIVYWYPKLKNNPYNLIHFAGQEYTDFAKLNITPKPDSLLRVFMVYQALDKPVTITPQEIKPFSRTGFAVVEWGGTELQ